MESVCSHDTGLEKASLAYIRTCSKPVYLHWLSVNISPDVLHKEAIFELCDKVNILVNVADEHIPLFGIWKWNGGLMLLTVTNNINCDT